MVWAVVPAGGCGRRMQSDFPKQYLPLGGRTVLEHALAPLLRLPDLEGLVLALAADDSHWPRLALSREPAIVTVTAGPERADSVRAGLEYLAGVAPEEAWVLVHDAVRPCLRDADLRRLIDELAADPVGGLLASRAQDTLKLESASRVDETLDRGRVWHAQTPQMFRLAPLVQALDRARTAGLAVTDEAQAMERCGQSPRLIEGRADNIKITRPGDLDMAAHILSHIGELEGHA